MMFVFRRYCRLNEFVRLVKADFRRRGFVTREQDVLLTYFHSQNTPTPLKLALGIWKMRQYAFHFDSPSLI